MSIVGSGASAIQAVPGIVFDRKPASVTVYIRSPAYCVRRGDYLYPTAIRFAFRLFPFSARLYRWLIYWSFEMAYPIMWRNSVWSAIATWLFRRWTKEAAGGRDELVPNETAGCRRILSSDEYFLALRQPGVTVVRGGVVDSTSDGLLDDDGVCRRTDLVIAATGFRTGEYLLGERIPHAYLGMCLPSRPNFFMMYGPNTNLGHNSIVFQLECQAGYIAEAIRVALVRGSSRLSVRPTVFNEYVERTREEASKLVFAEDCGSWYSRAEGINSSTSTLSYWWATRHVDWTDFIVD